MTNFYDLFMIPLEKKWLQKIRAQIIPYAKGHLLEIGYGTGVNHPFINCDALESYTALDLDIKHRDKHCENHSIHFVEGRSESLPFENESFDTVMETLVLCSVSDLRQSLDEIFRVLKPGGHLIYLDHVLPESPPLKGLFKKINRLWPHIASGCEVIRTPHLMIAQYPVTYIESGSAGKSVFRYGVVRKN